LPYKVGRSLIDQSAGLLEFLVGLVQ
jgi:hypothetical protein